MSDSKQVSDRQKNTLKELKKERNREGKMYKDYLKIAIKKDPKHYDYLKKSLIKK